MSYTAEVKVSLKCSAMELMLRSLKDGDKVQLNTGGPLMTVQIGLQGRIYCVWHQQRIRCQGIFPREQLRLVDTETDPAYY